jgi:hypothetical protein
LTPEIYFEEPSQTEFSLQEEEKIVLAVKNICGLVLFNFNRWARAGNTNKGGSLGTVNLLI